MSAGMFDGMQVLFVGGLIAVGLVALGFLTAIGYYIVQISKQLLGRKSNKRRKKEEER